MSLASVRAYLMTNAPDLQVRELDTSTATVPLAASALGVAPGQIAKSLVLDIRDIPVVLVVAGDAKIDNAKYKAQFGVKARMMSPEDVQALTSHPVGGVTPFGLADGLQVYCDRSLLGYPVVYPAGGAAHAAVEVEPARLAQLVDAAWVDVTKQ